ncbi:MAG: hypothetical protein IT230_02940 [Flavobacteriales bacterium]|nr:hypothetical protein [Flavobacteriales bacterium]
MIRCPAFVLAFGAASIVTAQDYYESFVSPMYIRGVWNDQPILATTGKNQVVLDYETATFHISFDPSDLRTGIAQLDSVLITRRNQPVVITGKFQNVSTLQTRDHPPTDYKVEGRLSEKTTSKSYTGKARMEHIFAGRYACLLDIDFAVPVKDLGLERTFPGLSGYLTFYIRQSLLRRATD